MSDISSRKQVAENFIVGFYYYLLMLRVQKAKCNTAESVLCTVELYLIMKPETQFCKGNFSDVAISINGID